MTFRYKVLGVIAAVPTWIAIGALTAFFAADALGRLIFNQPLPFSLPVALPVIGDFSAAHTDLHSAISQYAAVLLFLALPFAALFACLECFRARASSPDTDLRSSLGIWPGLPLGIVGLFATLAASPFAGAPSAAVLQPFLQSLDVSLLTGPLLAIASAAAISGGRPAKATAVIAAPIVLTSLAAIFFNASIASTLLLIIGQLAIMAIAFIIAGFVSGNHGLFWWAAGPASVMLILPPVAAGLLTVSEAMAIVALVTIPIGLLVNSAVRRTGLARTMFVATAEIGALTAIMAFAGVGFRLAAFLGFQPRLEALAGIAPALQIIILVLAMIVLGVLLTPMLAAAIALSLFAVPALLNSAAIDLRIPSALLVLASLIAMMLRSIRSRAEPPPYGASSIAMSFPVALAMVGVTTALLVLSAIGLFFLSLAR
ncbi:MAG: hypothetical protein F9K44_06675 [Hyphomicrobiaceae bacterium]|nr:MAG: hypothetical protein F9K44_06675 [Hyphomicrobiaceae bacterium]